MARRDFEFFATYEDSEVTFKFEWTIGRNEPYSEGIISPTIELPNRSLHFKLKSGLKQCQRSLRNYDVCYLSIFASCPVNISGTIADKHDVSTLSSRSLNSGENEDVCTLSPYFTGSTKTLVFDMKVNGFTKHARRFSSKVNEKGKIDRDISRLHLENDIKKLWATKRLSDVQIRVGGHTISAHKNILSARSPVFESMFRHNTTEVTENVIEVSDVYYNTMLLLVGFLYGEYSDFASIKTMDQLCHLYYACDKYQVLYLRDVCGRVLVDRLAPENVHQLIELSDRHNDSELKKQVVDYCCSNFKDIVKLKQWESMVVKQANFFSSVFAKMADSKK